MSRHLIGIDVGGTFTDVLSFDLGTGELRSAKVPSLPGKQWIGVLEALQALGIELDAIAGFVHGTTIATNALLERKVAKVGLLTTEGFRDAIEVGRTRRLIGGLFDTRFQRPKPLVSRDLRLEVAERVAADGTVVTPLPLAEVGTAAETMRRSGVEAVAVGFLNAHASARHEDEAAGRLAELLGDIPISRSADVVRELGEFERISTTVANAALSPVVGRYIETLTEALASHGITAPVNIMGSNGGAMGLPVARRYPVRTFLSGPVGGVIGALRVARAAEVTSFITFDMGGTSTDVALIENELPRISYANLLDAYPLQVPQLDIHTIGAGGGSIAWREADGTIEVGPKSAGALPGPACYGRGGTLPTVSDANCVLGRLNDRRPLAGGLMVDRARAREAFAALAGRGEALEPLADGVLRLVVAKMAGAVREVTVHRGHDPQDFALLGFGGAGPMHVFLVAEELQIDRVVVPRLPGHLSALGQLLADRRHDAVRPWICRLRAFDAAAAAACLEELKARTSQLFAAEGVDAEEAELRYTADLRYAGQSFTLSVPVPGPAMDPARLKADFDAAHEANFGYVDRRNDAEIVNFRLSATVRVMPPPLDYAPEEGRAALIETAPVWFGTGYVDTPFLRRTRLAVGEEVRGPAVLEEAGGTTIMPPGWRAVVHPAGSLICERLP